MCVWFCLLCVTRHIDLRQSLLRYGIFLRFMGPLGLGGLVDRLGLGGLVGRLGFRVGVRVSVSVGVSVVGGK